MTATSAESKQFIGRYLQALSGQAKTADLVAKFVSDPALVAHINDVESAFPAYELIAEDLIAEGDRACAESSRVCIEARLLAWHQPDNSYPRL
jgi:hypothetical protein